MRPILQWPDKRLRTPADPVARIDDEIRAIWTEMVAVMEAMPGVGLAAPQIGVMLRLAVVDASDTRGWPVRLANPEVMECAPRMRLHAEASPCLPGVSATLERPEEVVVRFLNAAGEMEERTFAGLWSTSVQHQIDHLNGRMYFDKLGAVKRRMLLKKAQKTK